MRATTPSRPTSSRRCSTASRPAADPAGATVLDLAAGTGALSRDLIVRGARQVIALDLSWNMLAEGERRLASADVPSVSWVNADARRLPLAHDSVDAVTIGFGLRNVPAPNRAIAEFARVVRPGGRLVVLEFAAPTWLPFRKLYTEYLTRALPQVARLFSPSPEAYRYLAESIRAWPTRRTIADWMRTAGWTDVQVRDLSGGIVAVHRAVLG
jgi:demethylmenaquinone methyltransferase/2-methoxy-6-polyprenyl-1,4-benzoquinol methylase